MTDTYLDPTEAITALTLDLARANNRIARLTAERDRHQKTASEQTRLAKQRGTQLEALGDEYARQYNRCLQASADNPGQASLAARVRQAYNAVQVHEAITGRTA